MPSQPPDLVRLRMQDTSTQDLQAIWQSKDLDRWNPHALQVAKEVLQERGIKVEGEVPIQLLQPQLSARLPNRAEIEVTVTDIRMPFGSMVVFMVKWAIASIPAAIILIILAAVVMAVLGGVLARVFTTMR